jgi:hypothetical protein
MSLVGLQSHVWPMNAPPLGDRPSLQVRVLGSFKFHPPCTHSGTVQIKSYRRPYRNLRAGAAGKGETTNPPREAQRPPVAR